MTGAGGLTVAGELQLDAGAAALRALLEDPERLAAALPHVGELVPDDDEPGAFAALVRPALALGEIPLRTRWRRVADAGGGLRWLVDGRGDEHAVALDARLVLEDRGDGALARWRVECRFTGTVRSVGQRVLGAIVDRQVRQVLQTADRLAVAGR